MATDIEQEVVLAQHPRARAIAAIHAFADYLSEHPEVPYPESVTASAPFDGGTPELATWAEANGFTMGTYHEHLARQTVVARETAGVQVDMFLLSRDGLRGL
jgi:hypothetical protein